MRAALFAAVAIVGIASAQPIRHDKWIANIQKPTAERIEACRSGCYVLTSKELADGLQNAARLATLRATQPAPAAELGKDQQ